MRRPTPTRQTVTPNFSTPRNLRTSDKDKPNCRAIRVGLIPALKAARTALVWPRVNLGEAISGFGPRAGLPNDKGSFDTCAADPLLNSGRKSESNLPRRLFAGYGRKEPIRSTSFRYPTALFKFKGRAGRFGWRAAAGAPAFSGRAVRPPLLRKKTGLVFSALVVSRADGLKECCNQSSAATIVTP